MHGLMLYGGGVEITPIINILAIWKIKRLSGIKPREMSMWAGWVGRWICLVLLWVKRSRVKTVGCPTGSLQAGGGAPRRASPRPWCRPGQSLLPRPTLGHSCNGHRVEPHRSQTSLQYKVPAHKPATAFRMWSLVLSSKFLQQTKGFWFGQNVDWRMRQILIL